MHCEGTYKSGTKLGTRCTRRGKPDIYGSNTSFCHFHVQQSPYFSRQITRKNDAPENLQSTTQQAALQGDTHPLQSNQKPHGENPKQQTTLLKSSASIEDVMRELVAAITKLQFSTSPLKTHKYSYVDGLVTLDIVCIPRGLEDHVQFGQERSSQGRADIGTRQGGEKGEKDTEADSNNRYISAEPKIHHSSNCSPGWTKGDLQKLLWIMEPPSAPTAAINTPQTRGRIIYILTIFTANIV
jgi:hypothetical protein